MLTATGAQAGVRRGLPCLLGVSAGMGLMMFLVPLGLGSLVLGRPAVLTALHWGGAAFLLWLAWKIATSTSAIDAIDATDEGQTVGFVGAASFQWVNPKSWLVSASAASTFLSPGAGSPVWQAASLGGLFVVAALPSGFVWLVFGAGVQRLLRSRRRRRVFNVVMGVLLALSIVFIVR
jgi:threonine/homoserine/homoserine lactone efflux protein